MSDESTGRRFLSIGQAAEVLNVKPSLVRAIIRSGELQAIQIGNPGVWRVATADVVVYIAETYRRTAERIAAGETPDGGAGPETLR